MPFVERPGGRLYYRDTGGDGLVVPELGDDVGPSTDRLGEIKCPVQVIHGTADPWIPTGGVRAVSGLAQGGVLVVVLGLYRLALTMRSPSSPAPSTCR